MSKKKSKSPYVRHGKIPWKYSELHTQWKAAVLAGHVDEARAAAVKHYNRFVRFALPIEAPQEEERKAA